MDTHRSRPVEILLVEDNAGDVFLTQEAFEEGKIANHLSTVRDGAEALEFLRGKGQHTGARRPDIILLDLNLPKKNGRQVLEEIRSDPSLRTIPVIILTTSKAEEDILRTYNLGANCYVTKPVDSDAFFEAVRKIEEFWLTVVPLPGGLST